jgi:hypothetical protein
MKYIRIKSFLINLENVCQVHIGRPTAGNPDIRNYSLNISYTNEASEKIGMDNQTELNSYVEQIERLVNIK